MALVWLLQLAFSYSKNTERDRGIMLPHAPNAFTFCKKMMVAAWSRHHHLTILKKN
jgi:hypothetical protein